MIVLSDVEVERLDEYSCSLPTGTTVGKRWVRYQPYKVRPGRAQERWLGQYVEHADPGMVGIWWSPLLTETEAAALAAALFWWLPWGAPR